MKILIAGGTGYIGRKISKRLLENGHELSILTRDKESANDIFKNKAKLISWSDLKNNPLKIVFNPFDCIINLAGESLASHKWDNKTKERIISSRLKSTKRIVKALEQKTLTTKVLINASAIGYYGPHGNEEITESEPAGHDFLSDVCWRWEEETMKAENLSLRVVRMRTGVVLGDEGALQKIVMPYKFFAGGPIGNGRQYISWIHIDDLVNIYLTAIEDERYRGAINATSPNPVTMNELSRSVGKVLSRPSFFRVPAFAVRFIYGEMADTVLNGQKVIPKKLLDYGFEFKHPSIANALTQILKIG